MRKPLKYTAITSLLSIALLIPGISVSRVQVEANISFAANVPNKAALEMKKIGPINCKHGYTTGYSASASSITIKAKNADSSMTGSSCAAHIEILAGGERLGTCLLTWDDPYIGKTSSRVVCLPNITTWALSKKLFDYTPAGESNVKNQDDKSIITYTINFPNLNR